MVAAPVITRRAEHRNGSQLGVSRVSRVGIFSLDSAGPWGGVFYRKTGWQGSRTRPRASGGLAAEGAVLRNHGSRVTEQK